MQPGNAGGAAAKRVDDTRHVHHADDIRARRETGIARHCTEGGEEVCTVDMQAERAAIGAEHGVGILHVVHGVLSVWGHVGVYRGQAHHTGQQQGGDGDGCS